MADYVLDAAVLIDLARGVAGVREFLTSQSPGDRSAVHAVSAAEFLCGCRNKLELAAGRGLLKPFRMILPSQSDFRHCLVLVESTRLSHGAGWPDCLLAASCIRLGLPLVTLNVKHFRPFRALRTIRPY